MTIEEIKKWRKEGGSPHCMANQIIDTLLAEVATLEKHNAYADQYNAVQDLHLTIATESLESLISANTQRITTARYIARTALERIEDGNQK